MFLVNSHSSYCLVNNSGNVWRINILHPYNVINDISLLQFWNYLILHQSASIT
ncbi:unnamed protein product, partial [Larinioides sclopetarius]